MAQLPDPTDRLDPEQRAEMQRMGAARAAADGKSALAQVYVRMFNHPDLAPAVGHLGEAIRFHGVLPDDVRELAIMWFSARTRAPYEWSHHVRPAHLAGLGEDVLTAVAEQRIPEGLRDDQRAVVDAVNAVVAGQSIPAGVQQVLVDAHGEAGAVEVVVLCGLYSIMSYTCRSFDIDVEPGYPAAPF